MTHQYESEILNKLMERDGFNIPSSVPPYEAEIKAYLINQVKQAYPKLTDYEAEWLLYNYTKHLPADFPISSVSNVTEASFENVVPFAYQSAILRGQTLVNIVNNDNWVQGTGNNTSLFTQNISIKKGQSYTVIGKMESIDTFEGTAEAPAFRIRTGEDNNGVSLVFIQQTDVVFKQTFTNNNNDTIHLRFFNQKTNYKKLMIIEGDHTQEDISYFEGMQSVKTPVLTTSNEDGTKTNILSTPEDLELRGIGDVKDTLNCLTGELTERIGELTLNGDLTIYKKSELENVVQFEVYLPNNQKFINANGLCNRFPKVNYGESNNDKELVALATNYRFMKINVEKSKLQSMDVDGLKQYLQSNPITIQYELETESVKTVDLKTVNESGESVHFMPIEGTMYVQSSGEIIQPTFDMAVPVEATTQNLASFIDLEMEE